MNIAEVLPLQRLPRNQSTFDYTVPPKLNAQVGTLVIISFRTQEMTGVVLGLKKSSSVDKKRLKPIIKINTDTQILTRHQLRYLKNISQYYLTSPAVFAKLFIPEPLVRQSLKIYNTEWPNSNPLRVTLPQKLITYLKTTAKEKYIIHHHRNYLNLIGQLVAREKNPASQQAIILPDLARLNHFLSFLPSTWKKRSVVLHGQMPKGALNVAYDMIRQGSVNYIIGLKRTLFVPYLNLKRIWLIDEDDPSHKQYDQNPRFHVLTAAQLLGREHKAQLILTSQSPSLESWFKYSKNKSQVINIGKPRVINVITLSGARGDDRIISPLLRDTIFRTKGKVFLFVNQKGLASGITCQDCQRTLRCDRCDHVLSEANDGKLICKNCFADSAMPVACPNCHGTRLEGTGLTIQRVVKAVKQLLPDKKVRTLSKGESYPQQVDIIVGTQHITAYPKVKFNLCAVISIDQQLSRPSYDAEYRAWQIIRRLSVISDQLIVQTHESAHPFVRLLQKDSWRYLYQHLWQQRKQWHYPPAWFGIKLILRHKSEHDSLSEATNLRDALSVSPLGQPEIIGPFMLHPYHRANKYGQGLLVRWQKRPAANIMRRLQSLIPDQWQLDVDPADLN